MTFCLFLCSLYLCCDAATVLCCHNAIKNEKWQSNRSFSSSDNMSAKIGYDTYTNVYVIVNLSSDPLRYVCVVYK